MISKYVKINPEDIKVHLERQDTLEVLEVKDRDATRRDLEPQRLTPAGGIATRPRATKRGRYAAPAKSKTPGIAPGVFMGGRNAAAASAPLADLVADHAADGRAADRAGGCRRW